MPATVTQASPRRYRWLLSGGMALTLLIQWASLLWWADFEQQHVVHAHRERLQALAGIVRERTGALLAAASSRLQLIEQRISQQPGANPLVDREFARQLRELPSINGIDFRLRLVDRKGQLRSGHPGETIDLTQHPLLAAQRQQAIRQLLIAPVDATRLAGQPVLPLSWPIHQPGSRWMAAVALIDLDALLKLLEPLRVQPNGNIALLHQDGTLLTRLPYVRDYIGKSVRSNPNFSQILSRTRSGFYRTDSPSTDHVPRLMAFEHLPDQPLIVLAGAAEHDSLQAWQQQKQMVFVLGAVFSLLLTGLYLALLLAMNRMQQATWQLAQLATTDPLTGRMNRRAFDQQAEREFLRAQRYHTPLTVLMLDIDHFKRVNDTYGHAVGDTVLRQLSTAWHNALRQLDSVGRLGGEEFAILLPQTGLDDARMLAERLRLLTAGIDIPTASGPFRVTVSIGVSVAGAHDTEFSQILQRADMALYQAKQQGRNQVQSG